MNQKNEDWLGFANDQEILSQIQLETLLFSDTISKFSPMMSISQERNLVITNMAVYNFKEKVLKRRILVSDILGVTISNESSEFIIHGKGKEYDYRYSSFRKMKIIRILSEVYKKVLYKPLPIARTDAISLTNFVTTKSEKLRDPTLNKMNKETFTISDLTEEKKEFFDINFDYEKEKEFKDKVLDTKNFDDKQKRNKRSKSAIAIDIQKTRSASQTARKNFYDISSFEILSKIGRGNYASVYLAKHLVTGRPYVLKILSKERMIEKYLDDKNLLESTILELKIMHKSKYPFIGEIVGVSQTLTHLFMVQPFYNGGDLYFHLREKRMFDEKRAKMIFVQVALALQELHEKKIIYRDLKPENIVFDSEGYVRLIDFGLCRKYEEDRKAMSFCGTPEFLAPEVITGEGYDTSCDWWSMGILLYEMLYGMPPFYNSNLEKMYSKIVNEELQFPKRVKVSEEAKSLIIGLLSKNKARRLGSRGVKEILSMKFFKNIDISKLIKKEIEFEFKPKVKDEFDTSYFDILENDTKEFLQYEASEENKEKLIQNQREFDKFRLNYK